MQSRKHSAHEASANTVIGIAVSWALTFFAMPYWGYTPTVEQAAEVTLMFTIASFIRSYGLRRLFNWIALKETR